MRITMLILISIFSTSALHAQDGPTSPKNNKPADTPVPESIVIVGRADDLAGDADSASEGHVGSKDLKRRPISRVGELIEVVPGFVATQHSGNGKANQFFVRGFNLDHGTDFAASILGMPINMPTHAHGQGYTDLNFIIPEFVSSIHYRKGPYYADVGDFGSAANVAYNYVSRLDRSFASLSTGSYEYQRAVMGTSLKLFDGHLLFGGELMANEGPWIVEEDLQKFNGLMRYSIGDFSFTAMGYESEWTSTDQIPERALQSNLISRFGSLAPSDGGDTRRYSFSGQWEHSGLNVEHTIHAYVIDYQLDLFSNFTYVLDDPANGDQFEQRDRRIITGARSHHAFTLSDMWELSGGSDIRYDAIHEVALYATRERERIGTTRSSEVNQTSISPYVQTLTTWTPWLRSTLGVRGELYFFDINDTLPNNEGSEFSGMISPKASLVFGPWSKTEYYLNAGMGFHSNDARGATTTIDPKSLAPVSPVDPLVRSHGADVGVRTQALDNLTTTLSLWMLNIQSELLFVGDAGTTEASRPSRRMGIELTNFYRFNDWLNADLDLAFSNARFRDDDPAGDRIPGAVETVISAGISVENLSGIFASLRLRHFGPRPLLEDNSQRSKESTIMNARIGYQVNDSVSVMLEAFNLFDARVNDIEYYYKSQLPGEGGPVADKHFHPAEPFALRFTLSAKF